jgi:hypothetical protein
MVEMSLKCSSLRKKANPPEVRTSAEFSTTKMEILSDDPIVTCTICDETVEGFNWQMARCVVEGRFLLDRIDNAIWSYVPQMSLAALLYRPEMEAFRVCGKQVQLEYNLESVQDEFMLMPY